MARVTEQSVCPPLSGGSADFRRNHPYERETPVVPLIPRLIESRDYMRSIRQFQVPPGSFALWYLGQNGFIVKGSDELLAGIDLYLSNSCAEKFNRLPFRLNRQFPVFIEPEDLDIDVFITTHSHDDHADPETIRRVPKSRGTIFLGPFDSARIFRECGIEESRCRLIHPGETVQLGPSLSAQGTFALPTDNTDLNHMGVLLRFASGITFHNTGDTAYTEMLSRLLPQEVDVCAICINGGYHNLSAMEAAKVVKALRPRVVIPCHYDMMVNNIASPEMLRVALDVLGSDARCVVMKYYEPWVYTRS